MNRGQDDAFYRQHVPAPPPLVLWALTMLTAVVGFALLGRGAMHDATATAFGAMGAFSLLVANRALTQPPTEAAKS